MVKDFESVALAGYLSNLLLILFLKNFNLFATDHLVQLLVFL